MDLREFDVDRGTLPQAPDAVTVTLLARARGFLAHAKSHAALAADVDRMVAIHGFDNAVEFLLRIICEHFDVEARSGKNLDTVELAGLAGELDRFFREHYSTALPYLTDIKRLRQVRNLVQHGAVDPGNELARFERVVTRLYDRVFTAFFGVEPGSMALSSAVSDPALCAHLRRAEAFLADDSWLEAVAASRDAFEAIQLEAGRSWRVNSFELPARIEARRASSHSEWYFKAVRTELTSLRLGIEPHRFDRFLEYVEHLPTEFHPHEPGHTIMQRPWVEEDARFCYSFAADVVLRWESSRMDPLYVAKLDREYSFRYQVGPLAFPEGVEHTTYMGSWDVDEDNLDVFVIDQQLRDAARTLAIDEVYRVSTEIHVDGELETRITYQAQLRSRFLDLLTNNPARWQLGLELKQIPLTWHRVDFEGGVQVRASVCINTGTAAELTELYPVDEAFAGAFVKWRESFGAIRSIDHVRRAPGITEDQVRWFARFSRAVP